MEDERYRKLRDYALRLLSIRLRSIKEIKGKLLWYSIKKGIGRNLVDQVIGELISQNLLNDREFARLWVQGRRKTKPKGSHFIKRELQEKGIAEDLIEQVLKEEEKVGLNEYQLASELIQKKSYLFASQPFLQKKAKITNFLLRRGFPWEVIKKVVDSFLEKS